MISSISQKYQHAIFLAEGENRIPSEAEIQALWFESLIQPKLLTDTGEKITVVQPGIWNRSAGPDFFQCFIRDAQGKTVSGSVEIHLNAQDWETHGHHLDERYSGTILHGVWFRPQKTFFTQTKDFRRVPQTVLSEQLISPWAELSQIVEPLIIETRPLAQPGLCQRVLSETPLDQIIKILRSAGAWRLKRKADRLQWRLRTRGRTQGLWESLAETLGYSQNKLAMRLLAQRTSAVGHRLKDSSYRTALLFGLAGFLPGESLANLPDHSRKSLMPLWDLWWKERDRLQEAVLPREIWNLSGLRPNNRPERRIAALSHLHPRLRQLDAAIHKADEDQFSKLLLSITDPFWSHVRTWRSQYSPEALHLIGSERIKDILLNLFWPLVSVKKEQVAYEQLLKINSLPNQSTRIARERVLGHVNLGKALKDALVQQGLLQLYHDFCLSDSSACHQCPFPDLVRKFRQP